MSLPDLVLLCGIIIGRRRRSCLALSGWDREKIAFEPITPHFEMRFSQLGAIPDFGPLVLIECYAWIPWVIDAESDKPIVV